MELFNDKTLVIAEHAPEKEIDAYVIVLATISPLQKEELSTKNDTFLFAKYRLMRNNIVTVFTDKEIVTTGKKIAPLMRRLEVGYPCFCSMTHAEHKQATNSFACATIRLGEPLNMVVLKVKKATWESWLRKGVKTVMVDKLRDVVIS
jgi:hypothetical protein